MVLAGILGVLMWWEHPEYRVQPATLINVSLQPRVPAKNLLQEFGNPSEAAREGNVVGAGVGSSIKISTQDVTAAKRVN